MTENYQHINTLTDLLEIKVRNFVVSENELKHQVKQWIEIASSVKLKAILIKYEEFIQLHIGTLETFNKEFNITSVGLINKIMGVLIDDTNYLLSICMDDVVKDATLLSCIQTINHYKISYYGTLAAFAANVDLEKYKNLFFEAEVNERKIDDRLTQLAEYEINLKAKMPFVIENK